MTIAAHWHDHRRGFSRDAKISNGGWVNRSFSTVRHPIAQVGDRTLNYVTGSIAPVQGGLLLGQSFLRHFKSWSIDNQREALILN